MRARTLLIGGLALAFGVMCACLALAGGLLAYRSLPSLLRPSPTLPAPTAGPRPSLTPGRTPTAISIQPPPPTPGAAPTSPPSASGGLRLRHDIRVEGIIAIAVALDGRLTLFAADGQTGLLDPRTGEIAEGPTAPEGIEELVFAPDGRFFALRSRSGEVRVWDVEGQRTLLVLSPEEEVRRIAFSPRSTLLLVGGESTLSGYYVETGRRAVSFNLYGPANSFVMTPDERLIFQMTRESPDLAVWDTHTGEWWGSISFDPLTAIALSPDGRLLAAAENEMQPFEDQGYEVPFPTRVALWRIAIDAEQQKVRLDLQVELELQPEMEGDFGNLPLSLKALQFTPDGQWIVGLADWVGEGNPKGRLYVWETASGRMIGRAVLPPRPWQMALLEEGRVVAVLLASGPWGDRLQLYELPSR
ncbi:hypothetical protein HRbin22_00335 [Candidatus Thermoflexus japonica]|uniref:Uncharacterized protein n=1 Tax=Candidatus Thermoflexus japonica TaxID=2035417 RepID=A0A2H5Y3S7_9CHLR|nr:hypothetical protein HRbin22_00335 [Candidatus Thermoflexus japonica]